MQITTRRAMTAVVAMLVLVVSGCAGGAADTGADGTTDDQTAAEEETAAEQATATDEEPATDEATAADAEAAGATVAIASSDLGDIVVDGEGRTLYMFVPDDGGEPTCTDACAETWPVLEGPATAGEGVDAALLSTATHPSGATQVTYGDWPLYHFANDAAPGDVNGQGVNDVWFVVGPDGEPIRDAAAAGAQDTGY